MAYDNKQAWMRLAFWACVIIAGLLVGNMIGMVVFR